MSVDLKNLWTRAKDPILFTTLGVLLFLGVKNCSNGDAARETNETIKEVAANVDTIKEERRLDADTIKATTRAIHTVVKRTEKKVDVLQETADSILAKVDSCCDCNQQQPAPKKPVQKPAPKKPVQQPEPRKPVAPKDTVVIKIIHDTVVKQPEQPKNKVIQMYFSRESACHVF